MSDSLDKTGAYPSFENQMIYRLASLEATVTTSLRRIDEKIDSFQKDFHQKHTNQEAKVAAIDAKLEAHKEANREAFLVLEDKYDERIKNLEFFKKELVAKAMAVAAVIGLAWAVFGDAIQSSVGRIL